MTTLTCEEARGFAQACGEYANGVGDSFYRGAFRKAAEVIMALCDLVGRVAPRRPQSRPNDTLRFNAIADGDGTPSLPTTALSTDSVDNMRSAKENEEGKERTSPHTPYREKGKKEKKAATTTARVRVRVKENFFPPDKEDVIEYAEKKNIPRDFVDYWIDCMESNYSPPWFDAVTQRFITAWRRNLLVYWMNADKDKSWHLFLNRRNAEKARAYKPRKYTADEWCLCAERCSHFDAKLCKCRSGCAIPPEHREHPIAPEECERFHAKEVK